MEPLASLSRIHLHDLVVMARQILGSVQPNALIACSSAIIAAEAELARISPVPSPIPAPAEAG